MSTWTTVRPRHAGMLLLGLGAACHTAPVVPATSPGTPMTRPLIVPAPASFVERDGAAFLVTAATRIVAPSDSAGHRIAEGFAAFMRPATGYALPVVGVSATESSGAMRLELDASRAALGDEGYELDIDAAAVRLVAARPAGLFRGVQTLRQLLPFNIESDMRIARAAWALPAVHVADAPRFAWRGAMLDVARHFFTVKEVEQYIDLLALYKLNVLHLHLSDDQGWRIEIRSRPLLTSVGGATQVGGRAGGYYTQEEYASIVRYAADRYISVVPEIDMPGHTNAALAAYPALSCSTRPAQLYTGTDVGWSTFCVDKEETYALIDDVVRELAALTPGPFIHLGGDEVQALTPAQYAMFVERVQGIATAHGKRMVGWEEISHARLIPGTVAQHWRSDSVVKAVAQGAKVILSPGSRSYLDMKYTPETELGLHWAGYITVRTAYDWDPATLIPGVHEGDVLGVEAPIWSETLRNIAAVQYLAVPRLPALAEVGWSAQQGRTWDDFRMRLAAQAPRWRSLGINYFASPEIAW